jgi:hypothetical protein
MDEDGFPVTDPTGVSFISYRRTRSHEIERLVRAHHDHGIPTWRDTESLRNEQTEAELRRILRDPRTANAVLWVTPEVRDSPVIGKIEIPEIHRRHQARNGFFAVPVAADGLDYGSAEEIASQYLGLRDFKGWNFERVDSDPAVHEDAARITRVVLERRLEAIGQALSASDPIRLGIFTRGRPPEDGELHLAFDWQPRFDGRHATAPTWERALLPSLRTVAEAVPRLHPGRAVVARGQACLPALVALGAAFLEPREVHLIWQQHMRDSGDVQNWSLRCPAEESGFGIEVVSQDATAEDIGVCVTFRNTVHQAVKRGQESDDIPRFRAVVDASLPEGHSTMIDSPGKARGAVSKVAQGIHAAQAEYPAVGKLHLFMDAPAGFAVMLGQKLNGMGPIQTYEHEQIDGIGRYVPATLLYPGA